MAEKHYQNVTVAETGGAEVKIDGEISAERLTALRAQAVKNLGKDAEFDGFRKGHVPENILVGKLGEQTVLAEAAELALREAYPEIVKEHTLDVIGQPHITITKLAPGNPLGFSIKTAILKPITLPDYKALAQEQVSKKEDVAVSEEEVEAFVTRLLEQYAKAQDQQEVAAAKESEAESAILGPDGKPISSGVPKAAPAEQKPLELTDEFVKTLGAFENVADFREKLKANLVQEKERAIHEKKRAKIADAIIEKTDIVLPEVLVEYELDKMLAQFKGDIERMGIPADEYLKKSGKNEENMREEWRPDAKKRAKLQLILAEIAKKENLAPSREELDHEVEHVLAHNKDADPARVRSYLEPLMTNEKVFQLLEGKTAKKSEGQSA